MQSVIESETTKSIKELVLQVQDLPPLPNIVCRAMEIAHDPNGSVRELQLLISKDQALSAKILRIVNSPMYALRREVSTVSHAVSILGIDTVISIVMTASIENVFQSVRSLETKLLSDHSWGTAIAARTIAKYIRYEKPEEALVGGLMHDIGKPILMRNYREDYNEIISDVYNGDNSFYQSEMLSFGYSHAHVGALLAQKWGFPSQLEESVGYHHDPSSAPNFSQLAFIVNLANTFMVFMEIGFEKDKELALEKQPAAEHLKLNKPSLETIINDTRSILKATSKIG